MRRKGERDRNRIAGDWCDMSIKSELKAAADARKPYADEILRINKKVADLLTALRQISDEQTFAHVGKITASQALLNTYTIANDALLRFQQS